LPGIPAAIAEVLKAAVRFEYQRVTKEIITAGHNKRIYGERIEPGWILTVATCYLHVPQIGTPDIVTILVEAGAQELIIRSRGKEVGRDGISTLCPFHVGEYQRIVGYAPNSEINDTLALTVIGSLSPLWDWRRWPGKGA
jgi:hypothetical protein